MRAAAPVLRTSALQASRRGFATSSPRRLAGADMVGEAFKAERAKVADHAGHSAETWRKVSYYVCLPLIAIYGIQIYKEEQAHNAHFEHLKEENGGEMPERKVFPYMNIRRKAFPWGPQSFFFSDKNIPASDDV